MITIREKTHLVEDSCAQHIIYRHLVFPSGWDELSSNNHSTMWMKRGVSNPLFTVNKMFALVWISSTVVLVFLR